MRSLLSFLHFSPRQAKSPLTRHACQALAVTSVIFVSLAEGPVVASDTAEEAGPDDPFSRVSLCDWQADYSFFTGNNVLSGKADRIPCEAALLTVKAEQASSDSTQHAEMSVLDQEKRAFEAELREMLAGYPIEAMIPAIAHYERDIAGLIVGIAKKESNWGKRVPLDTKGADCFNYWGFKGAGARGIAMGHGCFGTAEEAVEAIGSRLQELVALRKTSEPKNLTVWKCGSSCATHSPESVRKWVSDVDLYFRAIARK